MRRADLADLTAFVAVANNLSFRAGASCLGVTPSALSHAEFGDTFARAYARRIDAFEEDILEIADQTEDDYRETLTGRMVPNKEVVLRSKVRIEARQWLMSKRDPKKWGDRQSVDVTANIMLLTPDETSAFAPEGFCPWRDRRRGWVAERKPPRRAVQPKKRGRSGTADGASAVALQNCLA
ncbi:MAG TPA: LysR family transcriptional regulator [Stellaceae bacterium]|nr:LysR family transcriptional regulator [Stellaceae bacterium]